MLSMRFKVACKAPMSRCFASSAIIESPLISRAPRNRTSTSPHSFIFSDSSTTTCASSSSTYPSASPLPRSMTNRLRPSGSLVTHLITSYKTAALYFMKMISRMRPQNWPYSENISSLFVLGFTTTP